VEVLVINADLGPLHRVTVKRAVRMLLRRVAEIHEAEPDRLIGVYPITPAAPVVGFARDALTAAGGRLRRPPFPSSSSR
jgi:hypothetical protein